MDKIATIVTSLVAGAFASLLAPWAKWGVEKRRARADERVARIREWRAGLATYAKSDGHTSPQNFDWYASLRPNLESDEISGLESVRTVVVPPDDGGPEARIRVVRDAIGRIEAEWKVV